MADTTVVTSDLTSLAEESLGLMALIEQSSMEKIREVQETDPRSVFAWEDERAVANYRIAQRLNFEGYSGLSAEPFIAKIEVRESDGSIAHYYFSRFPPLSGFRYNDNRFASYHSVLGRLASFDVGAEVEIHLPSGTKRFEIISKLVTRPQKRNEWDGVENIFREENGRSFSIKSLRAVINRGLTDALQDGRSILQSILTGASGPSVVVGGIQRAVIDRMTLRDQPILDRYQDEIFRLPMNSQMLLVGPPGAGKTTTLIRRLGQKLTFEFLTDEEKGIISSIGLANHAGSWVMFTPTELLKLYVREAFNKEGIPASESRIKTWSHERVNLARNILDILRTPIKASGYVYKNNIALLTELSSNCPIDFYEAWSAFFADSLEKEIREAIGSLQEAEPYDVAKLLPAITMSFRSGFGFGELLSFYRKTHRDLKEIEKRFRDLLKNKHNLAIAALLDEDKQFLHSFADLIDSLQIPEDIEDVEDFDDEESYQDRVAAAYLVYKRTIESLAKSQLEGRALGKSSRSAKILEWLGSRVPPSESLREIGIWIKALRAIRKLSRPVGLFVNDIPKYFQKFRNLSFRKAKFYRPMEPALETAIKSRVITDTELDAIILLMLRNSRVAMSQIPAERFDTDPQLGMLAKIKDSQCNQILVDEATDFSAIQLASMLELSHPKTRSFFACGDLRQRITSYGIRSYDEIEWVEKAIEVKPIEVLYRQSKKLAEFAAAIAKIEGEELSGYKLPERINLDGFLPVLSEYRKDQDAYIWLSERIAEIFKAVGKLPSTSIFVNGEDEIEQVVQGLRPLLQEQGIEIVACRDGKVMGNDQDIRVFNVQHIKGLEFEAVFFLGIDTLANRTPDLVNKFLYVGSTRAATYFGAVCDSALPLHLDGLRPHFRESWC